MIMTTAAPASCARAAAFGAYVRAEMRGRDDDRHAGRDMFECGALHDLAFHIAQYELLGEVRENA
ncbi:hypothetical protein HDG33_007391 [Paraburkholderia sp. Cpub6]|nr:hypothetical protein [Paraburkholderia sp. Cpub6]